MLRLLSIVFVACAAHGLALNCGVTSPAAVSRTASVTMAHHVQKKATKKHQATRPRKSRPSDITRKPPQSPQLPDQPWMTPIAASEASSQQMVTITLSPSDSADSVREKLQSAGAVATEEVYFSNQLVTSTLGDCGLQEEKTIEVAVVSQP
mmetsp:Transcript_29461/g.56964  ORF Transcript_29461/g.56964 Transcript_29461/m.56964 type:complete len:151 (+) Transcript_29461:115-567(+)